MLQKVKNIFHFFEALAATLIYRFPSKKLTVIGVTGTDGKTTTTTLIHHILATAGFKTAILSTLSSAHTTTPGRFAIQRFLRRSLDNGCTHAVLEVTSIAVDQYRTWGTRFAIGVLTNIANNEHLDYHGNFVNYRQAKLKFLKSCQVIVANGDDSSAEFLPGAIFYRLSDWKKYHYQTDLLGDFNKSNILAASTVARNLNIDESVIKKAVASFPAPSGRLEIVIKKPFTVIVDFAHTPQAFEKVLPIAKKMGKRLIHVFGATGDRDKSKRPLMGAIAEKFDDEIILTSEDTYSEDPGATVAQIEAGIKNYELRIKEGTLYEILDRWKAIKKALELARPGDVILLTGVGHQRSMNIGGKEIPWSEQKVVKEILNIKEK